MARIVWRDHRGNERVLELDATEILIGRAAECALRADDDLMSRRHARVFWNGTAYVIEDISASGSYFEAARFHQHVLAHGDVVQCGHSWLRFVDE